MFNETLNIIKSTVIIVLFIHSQAVYAINNPLKHLTLNCQKRGYIEVIFHLYGNVQEKWGDNFEVGTRQNNTVGYEIASFTNGDILFHNLRSNTFIYHYFDNSSILYSCETIYQSATHPVNLINID